MANNDKKYIRGRGLVERFGEKRGKELEKAIKEAVQPEDMDCQGGSGPDFLQFHLMNDKPAGRSRHER